MRLVSIILRWLFGTTVDVVTWRASLARTDIRLRLRGLVSAVVVVGGIGTAIGFAVVERLERQAMREEDEDETTRSPE
jgi:hypothetical protein